LRFLDVGVRRIGHGGRQSVKDGRSQKRTLRQTDRGELGFPMWYSGTGARQDTNSACSVRVWTPEGWMKEGGVDVLSLRPSTRPPIQPRILLQNSVRVTGQEFCVCDSGRGTPMTRATSPMMDYSIISRGLTGRPPCR
jgi:hypothetical protein